ncbi:acetylxylan esterase [Rhodocytophaga aerolata]|uniref:Acetylxylan esterase n=1 Tax=Rhodocytophaga aerolata TaxID=455078 RepID=A0ABT8R367_9BACT|nr:acetylxylan esterase [Rhodocytophaga aerolata]MDO1446542.1 acetylxylan esterase [Rhodocytophaga aerolata]
MRKTIYFCFFYLLLTMQGYAQMSQQARDSINRLNNEDHQAMMKLLNISALRPGPSGNPQAPNAANADESKATTYTSLPDPLVFKDGTKVKSPKAWEKRKFEIMEDFSREMYGRLPSNIPKVTWEVVSQKDTMISTYPAKEKKLLGHVDNSSYPAIQVAIQLTLTTPASPGAPVPVMVEFGWNFPPGMNRPPVEGTPWQQQVLAKGWGYAILIPTSFQADNGAGLKEGIIGLVNKGQPRKADDWGTLRAWAWGASRAIDYFETDEEVDPKRIVIEGLSRYGKAAIVAMAYEPRIAMGFIGSSGAGGAKILRRTFGEQVENLAASGEYHWFAPNFIKYAGPLTPNDLPVDAHHLVAVCAPRPVFISVGSPAVEGNWIDAKGMFLAAVHASPVYELLGEKGLETDKFPPQETTLTKGDIAFRQHAGGHTVVPNWPYFLEFADRYFSNGSKARK